MKRNSIVFVSALVFSLAAHGGQGAATPQDVQADMAKMAAAQNKILQAMMLEKPSRLGFEETVATLQRNAQARGWKLGGVFDAQDAMHKAGHKEAKPMKVLGMCPEAQVEAVLKAEQQAKLPPAGVNCRYSVYEGMDGKIYVMRFNTALTAKMAKGDVATALFNLAKEEDAIMAGVVR
ncbi:MAG TPA: DUF302 domain-containing protein [Thiobacillaceae bacterium]|nr:DUF302 domain-containing protein [Thiobacillaceae bacterium]